MNAITLYNVYEAARDNKAPDLTIGLAMFRDRNPGAVTHEEDKAIREFMGRHGRELAAAFPDREKFAAAVAEGVKKDQETAGKAEPQV